GAVERVEHDVGLERGEAGRDVAVHVELADVGPAALAQRGGDAATAGQRHLALASPAAHQHHDVAVLVHSTTPTRWISHSSVMLVLDRTRRRTSSPSSSMSALDALPRFSRKLQCFSETWASPC